MSALKPPMAAADRVANAMAAFVRMYEPHEAREDTVVYPAFRALLKPTEIADLGDFYRKVWRCGEAGVEVPIEIIRDGRALGLRIESADRAGFLKRPRLQ